ncbi:HAD family hydrolase [Streptomyces sp. NPDC001880]
MGSTGAITEHEVRARVAAVLGLDPVRTEAFMADLWDEYLGSPDEDLIAHVRSLRSRCRLGILSNSFVGAREREQELYGFGGLVDDIVYSHEIGISKPDPGAFEVTCARLGVRPEGCLFVDDAEADSLPRRRSACEGFCSRTTWRRSRASRPTWRSDALREAYCPLRLSVPGAILPPWTS